MGVPLIHTYTAHAGASTGGVLYSRQNKQENTHVHKNDDTVSELDKGGQEDEGGGVGCGSLGKQGIKALLVNRRTLTDMT